VNSELILSIHETAGITRKSEFIQIGIPLPAGTFHDASLIQLSTENKTSLASEKTASSHWPDNSIKWCLIKFPIALNAGEKKSVYLTKIDKKLQPGNPAPVVTEKDGVIEINTKHCQFHINSKEFNLFEKTTKDGQLITDKGFCNLINGNDEKLIAAINDYSYRTAFTDQQPLYTDLILTGQFKSSHDSVSINFNTTLTFYFESDLVKSEITLHNPNRSTHPSNKWDLGEKRSLYIKDFSLGFNTVDTTDTQWKVEATQDWSSLAGSTLNIYQESSGGENWNSPNHQNKDGFIPMQHKGYICEFENKKETGNRACPLVKISTQSGKIGIGIDKFWQNFPRSLGISDQKVEIGLFPKQYPDTVELQPGEKKTHNFHLNFGDMVDEGSLHDPLIIRLNPDWIDRCKVFKNLLNDSENDPVQKIIEQGLLSKDFNFFAKRETLDEYGWRNFGDIYADHETSGYKGDDIFVSHYNNQYDPLLGFLHQYMLTGENKWFELAEDLARHIADIDIYHTVLDKEEYNGGLFWHTDHYVVASTSSHRSYSRNQVYIYENYFGGGGPGGQHCYTAGLLHHHLLTGSESSKQAVFQLCDWMTHIYEGSGTLFSLLIAIKNSKSRIDLKNILTGKYPFDRGTGYYMNTLMDKFQLTNDRKLIQQVAFIIQNTVHPTDDISSRNLDNVEITWFYTIFFQSVIHFLQIKEELSELDDEFYYARDTLLHYADWMAEHESPYLQKPDILEYPNHTWTAQDIRKVLVLLYADYYSDKPDEKYRLKAQDIYQYIADNLSTEPTKTYSRILSILMQNAFPHSMLEKSSKVGSFDPVRSYEPLPQNSTYLFTRNLISELFKVIRHFSIKKEIIWLTQRSHFFAKLFGNR